MGSSLIEVRDEIQETLLVRSPYEEDLIKLKKSIKLTLPAHTFNFILAVVVKSVNDPTPGPIENMILMLTNVGLELNLAREIAKGIDLIKIIRRGDGAEAEAILKRLKHDKKTNTCLTFAIVIALLYWLVLYKTPTTNAAADLLFHLNFHGVPAFYLLLEAIYRKLDANPIMLDRSYSLLKKILCNSYGINLTIALTWITVFVADNFISGNSVYGDTFNFVTNLLKSVLFSIAGLVGIAVMTKGSGVITTLFDKCRHSSAPSPESAPDRTDIVEERLETQQLVLPPDSIATYMKWFFCCGKRSSRIQNDIGEENILAVTTTKEVLTEDESSVATLT